MNISSTVIEIENWIWKMEKNRGFGIQKVAKTGNIGEKKSPVAGDY